MDDKMIGLMTPEEEELEKKRNELMSLNIELSKHEEALREFEIEMNEFEDKFARIVGRRFARIDELDEKLGEFKKSKKNEFIFNEHCNYKIYESNNCGTSSDEVHENKTSIESSHENKKKLKNLYRKIVKQIHPDTVLDEKEKALRNELMAELNQAYAENDKEKMKRLFSDWKKSSNNVNDKEIASELINVIREIHEVKERIYKIHREFEDLSNSDLFNFKIEVDYLNHLGIDPLYDICIQLDREIMKKKKQLMLLSILKLAAKNNNKINNKNNGNFLY